MSSQRLVYLLTVTALIAGCGRHSDHLTLIEKGQTSIANGAITLQNDKVAVHADGSPDAVVDAAGNLSIGDRVVTLSPPQRVLLQHYYTAARAVREHGIATGKAGAAMAGDALKSAATGLVGGHPDQIDQQIEAKAGHLKEVAMQICNDLADIKAAQDSLAPQLPAFAPYAHAIGDEDIKECREH